MSGSWRQKLADDRVVVIDGGTGSELRRRGFRLSGQAWSGLAAASHQHLLREIHADYIRAGADVITANTFGTARFVLESAGRGSEFRAINERAVAAALQARDATGADVAVAGSISCLPPGMNTAAYPDPDTEGRAYRELAELLAEQGVDLLVLEMMQDDEHAGRACEAAASVGLPWWLGLSCRFGGDGRSVVGFDYPDTPIDVPLRALRRYEPAVINVMHTPPPAVAAALAEISSHWDGPTGAYPVLDEDEPDAGDKPGMAHEPDARHKPGAGDEPGMACEPDARHKPGAGDEPGAVQPSPVLSPGALARLAAQWADSGALVLGGCCGATPDHIRALSDVALKHGNSSPPQERR